MTKTRVFFGMIMSGLVVLTVACGTAELEAAGSPKGEKRMTEGQQSSLATLAGGCFWCLEADLAKVPGVIEVVSGYTGGWKENPTYEEVCRGDTGHYEAVQIKFDPRQLSYKELLDYFWRSIDPTDGGGQFVDRGPQYRPAIFYHDEEQRRQAEASKAALARSGRFAKPMVVPILPAAKFYPAEAYHQKYYQTCPVRYQLYRQGSGRDQFLEQTWGSERSPKPAPGAATAKPPSEVLKRRLTPLQYHVTQENGTEPPFRNEYWDNHREGIYVDIVSGEPLFSSRDKFDSGTGWPSFTRPLVPENIVARRDLSHGLDRVEIRSRGADSHLGHVFPDGPPPTGRRYCLNSAALRFIPKEDLEKEGYGQFLPLFSPPAK